MAEWSAYEIQIACWIGALRTWVYVYTGGYLLTSKNMNWRNKRKHTSVCSLCTAGWRQEQENTGSCWSWVQQLNVETICSGETKIGLLLSQTYLGVLLAIQISSKTEGLNFMWCCVEPEVGLSDLCGFLPI